MFESDFLPVPNLKLYSGEWKGTAEMQKAINYPNLSKTPSIVCKDLPFDNLIQHQHIKATPALKVNTKRR